MYAQIVAMLFPAYIIGCVLAMGFAWSKRSLYLAFAYSYLLITFQFFISGRAVEFGATTFLYCAFVQIGMGLCAMVLNIKPSRTIALGSVIAVALNALAAAAFTLHHPIRTIYFVGINTVQTIQILSMITLSPAFFRVYHLVKTRYKEATWTHRADFGIR